MKISCNVSVTACYVLTFSQAVRYTVLHSLDLISNCNRDMMRLKNCKCCLNLEPTEREVRRKRSIFCVTVTQAQALLGT